MNQAIPKGYIEHNDDNQMSDIPKGFVTYSDAEKNSPSSDIPKGFIDYKEKDSYADDLIDSAQAGFYEATGNLMIGTRQLLTDTQEPWDIEQSQYDASKTNLNEIDPQRRNEMEQWGFGEADDITASNTGMQIANALGSLAPTMVPGGVVGKGLQVGTKVADLGKKAQKVAQATGYGVTGGAMIGGSSANEVGQAIDSMAEDELQSMPEYIEILGKTNNPELARKEFKYRQEQIASKQGAALGGASMAIAGPILQRIAMGAGGQSAGNRIISGAVTEGIQEGFEEGGQGVIANVNTGKPTFEGVGERSLEGAVLGAGTGGVVGTVGAGMNALSHDGSMQRNPDDTPIQDDQGNIVGYRDAQTSELTQEQANTDVFSEERPSAIRTPGQATGTLDKALLSAGIDAQNPDSSSLLNNQIAQEQDAIQAAVAAGELSPRDAELALQNLQSVSGDVETAPQSTQQPFQSELNDTQTNTPQNGLEATISGLEADPNWQQNELGEWLDGKGNQFSLPSDDTTTQTVTIPPKTPVSFKTVSGKRVQGTIVGTNSKGNYRVKLPTGITVTKRPDDIQVMEASNEPVPFSPGTQVTYQNKGQPIQATVKNVAPNGMATLETEVNNQTKQVKRNIKFLTQMQSEQKNRFDEDSNSFNVKVEHQPVQSFDSPVKQIKSTADAAAIAKASIGSHADESMLAIIADAEGHVLNVLRHTKGTKAESSVYAGDLVSAVTNTPGAAQVTWAHVHPSGLVSPSASDLTITEKLSSLLNGTGIKDSDHVVVGPGNDSFFSIKQNQAGKITTTSDSHPLFMNERVITRHEMDNASTVNSPAKAKELVKKMKSANGILFFDNRNRALGEIELTIDEMVALKDGDIDSKALNKIYRAIDTSNASAVILKTKEKSEQSLAAAKNVARFLNAHGGVRLLDHFADNQSGAEVNSDVIDSRGIYYSKKNGPKKEPLAKSISEGSTVTYQNKGKLVKATVKTIAPKGMATLEVMVDGKTKKVLHHSKFLTAVYSEKKSVKTNKTTSQTKQQLDAELKRQFGHIIKNVITLDKQSELPAHIKDDNAVISGAYDPKTKKIYLVAENISREESKNLLMHEVVHGALRHSPAYKDALRMIHGLRHSKPYKAAKQAAEDAGTSKEDMHEEILAYLIQHHRELSTVQKIIARIKQFLRNKYGWTKITTNDVYLMVEAMAKGDTNAELTLPNGAIRFHAVFHGTPHSVDKFDMSKVGNGEGVQAQGFGLYFAGEKWIAKWYREKLSAGQEIPIDILKEYFAPGNIIPGYGGYDKVVSFDSDKSLDWSVSVIHVNKDGSRIIGERERIHSTAPSVKNIERFTGKKLGNLYGVDLKPTQEEYLDWDKPLTKQSKHVKDAIVNMGMGSYISDAMTGRKFYNKLSSFYKSGPDSKWMVNRSKADKKASEELLSVGIRGNKYMDATTRNGGKGDYNYVIFDDADIEITAKYSKKQPKEIAMRLHEAVNSSNKIADFLKNKTEDWRPNWLGALTLRQLADIGKAYLPQVKDYVDLNTLMQTERNETTDQANEQAEVWRKYAARNRKEADQLASLMHASTMAGVDPSKSFNAIALQQSMKQHIKILESRLGWLKNKEARQAVQVQIVALRKQLMIKRNAYPEIKKNYDRLSDEAKQLYKDVRDAYLKQSQRALQALEDRITDSELTGKQKKVLIDKMRLQHEQTKAEGPYFPLSRFGSLWLSAKAPNGENEFFMFENHADLKRSEKQLRAEGYSINAQGRKIENAKFINGASEGFMGDLNQVLQRNGIASDSPLMDEIYQAYLRTMPDLSLRKNFIHRKQTKGHSNDALRAFASQMTHGAIQTARLRYGGKMSQLLKDMNESVRESHDSTKAAAMLNEMNKRHEWVMNPTNSKVAQKASSIGFSWYLGVSPAAAMVNLTQNALMAMPVIGATHGMVKTAIKMNKVLGEFLKAKGDFNLSLEGHRLRAFKKMQSTGAIDMSLSHNLAGLGDTDTLHYNPTQHKIMTGISFLFHKAEVLNRAVTGMTAYDLHLAQHKNPQSAIKYAEEAIWESQYDYANANRARFMQGDVAKVVLMFRQYSQNVTYYLWRNFYQTFKGESKAVRLEARKKLTGTLAVSTMMSGALGLPLVTTGFAIANLAHGLFGDDDEPFDAEVETRSFFADYFGKDITQYILDGPTNKITGASIASRVALNDLWLRAPNRDQEGRDLYHYYLEQIAGPMGGIVLNAMRGTQLIEEGKHQRGFETMLPKALKDAAKAFRYEQEGVNNLKGNSLIDDVSAYEEVIQAMGFNPARVNEQYTINNALKNYESHILNRRSFLLAQYAMAMKGSDFKARQKTLRQMRDFSVKYPRLRITSKTLRHSMKSRFRYANSAQNGINLNKNLQDQLMDKVAF